ncbi:MAG: carboxypeptidase Taq, partial [Candidatus Paceibacteria bacterium]
MSSTPYEALTSCLRETAVLGSVNALVSWDQETYMVGGGAEARSDQLALLAGMVHERQTSSQLGDLISACEADESVGQDGVKSANLREVRRDYDLATKLPAELVSELAKVGSQSQEVWKEARANSDFAAFAPFMEKMLELTRRKAECRGIPEGGELYDALLDEYEPGANAKQIEGIFGPLRGRLASLIADVAKSPNAPDESPLEIPMEASRQHEFGQFVLKAMGFDLSAGRLDTTAHPFCTGIAPGDTRLTTRYDGGRFTEALYGTMHEGGHGIYEQGLPKTAHHGLPASEALSLGIHESQSRLWENLVGRSMGFWTWALPHARRILSADLESVTPEAMYRAVNTAKPTFIRVEADEATYNLHVMLRFELERSLIKGELAVKDLPAAWNEKVKEYLGLDVPNDAEGCLADV